MSRISIRSNDPTTSDAMPVIARITMLAAIVLMLTPTAALAQQREMFDTRTGKSIGRATTDSAGSTTIYDSTGRVAGRTSTGSNGTTTVYDAGGRSVGTVTKGR